jgi:hypothetical protein
MTHYKTSEEFWTALAEVLAPPDNWKVLDGPALASLTVRSAGEVDPMHHTEVRIEPSVRVAPGVYVEVTDYYATSDELEDVEGCSELIDLLDSVWDASVQRSREIIDYVLAIK